MICDIEVSDEASMVVTTPGATRSHFMRSGIAKVEQKFRVSDGSFLEFNPGSLILQKSTALEQNTLIDITESAEYYMWKKYFRVGLPVAKNSNFRSSPIA